MMMTDQPNKFEVYQAKWLQAERYLTIKGVFIPRYPPTGNSSPIAQEPPARDPLNESGPKRHPLQPAI